MCRQGPGSPQDAIGAAHLDALFVFTQRVPAFAGRASGAAPHRSSRKSSDGRRSDKIAGCTIKNSMWSSG